MENFTWDAVPSQRQRKTEKYNYPVMTMAALTKPGAGRKFSFNKAAQELMSIEGEDRISFGFSADRTVVAIRKADEGYGFKLTKTCTLSDKKTFEFISKTLELSNDVENEFKISNKEGIFLLKQITEDLNMDLNNHNEESEVAEVTLNKNETTNTVEVTEEVADTIGNVNYPEVEEKIEVTSSEDVNNQW
tara:strand:+ start:13247 stop:13816 length:570 start_codon:yes stop_codon:yes gene_type:complete